MKIRSHKELRVWQDAMDTAMTIFQITKSFPKEENYSLTDQIRRSSRSVAANISEAWRKRRYQAAFISRLSDSETEAGETQTWIEISLRCGYIDSAKAKELDGEYEKIIGQLVTMIQNPGDWIIESVSKSPRLPIPLS